MMNQNTKINKCRIIAGAEGIIEGRPNETVFVEVALKNNTNEPYKQGCSLKSLFTKQDENNTTQEIIEEVVLPMEEVQPMTNFTVLIPMTIKADAIPNSMTENNKDYYELMFGMKSGWWNFGETMIVKLRVLPVIEDHQIFTKVNNMIVANPDDKITFEEAMSSLK